MQSINEKLAENAESSQILYSKAEQCCPQKMPIAQLMKKAIAKLES
jgi:hypothetical protein